MRGPPVQARLVEIDQIGACRLDEGAVGLLPVAIPAAPDPSKMRDPGRAVPLQWNKLSSLTATKTSWQPDLP
jgi:hypothetical protein